MELEGVCNVNNSAYHTYGRREEAARLELEDQESLCLALHSVNEKRFYESFYHRLGWINAEYFSSPEALQPKIEREWTGHIRSLSGKKVYSWNVLAEMVREQFSGYFLRKRTPAQDWKLCSSICYLRSGTLQKRREAVRILEKFQGEHAIKAYEVRLHDYTADFSDVFSKFTKGREVPAGLVQNWLDHSSFEWHNQDFEDTVRREYGYWPFAYGASYWEKSAVQDFSYSFAHCTKAPFVYEGESKRSLEFIYESICTLAAASHRERCLNYRLTHLREAGALPAQLKRTRLVAALENQIQGGFKSRDDWPQWLREATGLVKAERRPCNRQQALPVPASDGVPGQWDGEASDGSALSSPTSDDDLDEEVSRPRQQQQLPADVLSAVKSAQRELAVLMDCEFSLPDLHDIINKLPRLLSTRITLAMTASPWYPLRNSKRGLLGCARWVDLALVKALYSPARRGRHLLCDAEGECL
eukprot:7588697-Karenia_brevis.AAC.2